MKTNIILLNSLILITVSFQQCVIAVASLERKVTFDENHLKRVVLFWVAPENIMKTITNASFGRLRHDGEILTFLQGKPYGKFWKYPLADWFMGYKGAGCDY